MKKIPCYALSIRSADRVISQIYSDFLAPLGIKGTQFSVLSALYVLETGTASRLQKALVMDQTTVSRALKPLIRDGYVDLIEGRDKREKLLFLTDKGKGLYREAKPLWQKAQNFLEKQLGRDELDVMINVHRKILAMKS